jgi:hypothetical protein
VTFTTERRAELVAVLRYEFHGILHFELRYVVEGDPSRAVHAQRVASHQVYADPLAGDRIVLELLLEMVHRVRLEARATGATPESRAPAGGGH